MLIIPCNAYPTICEHKGVVPEDSLFVVKLTKAEGQQLGTNCGQRVRWGAHIGCLAGHEGHQDGLANHGLQVPKHEAAAAAARAPRHGSAEEIGGVLPESMGELQKHLHPQLCKSRKAASFCSRSAHNFHNAVN